MRHNTWVSLRGRAAILLAAALLAAASPALAQRRLAPRSFPPPEPADPVESEPARGPGPVSLPEPPPRDLLPPLPGAGRAAPTEDELGVTLYPNSTYLATFDAGRGQQFHLFGTNATFANMVRYYRVITRDRGEDVFEAPATHQFDIGRFRDREMDFRPSVTIKDYTWNGSPGYPNPLPGGDPPAFATIIQFTTAPPGARR
ncbi:MAG: hypothetical protein OXH04_20250 [Acidobacteria bacterium]|nr:hypothetical protein [Acidobacteriota bacterium]